MALSGDSIRRKSNSQEEFEKGKNLFLSGSVQYRSSESFWKGEEKLKMSVKDGGRTYDVSLLVRGDSIAQASCQCAVHKKEKGLCRHEAAAAFCAAQKRGQEGRGHVSTSPEVKRMLQLYAGRSMTKAVASGLREKISLRPVLRENGGSVFLYLKVGLNRFYVIRDLVSFVHALKDDAYVEYGKQLGFYHSMDAFDPESERLAREVSRLVDEYLFLYGRTNPYRAIGVRTLKEIELSPGDLDRVTELLAGQSVSLELQDAPERTVRIMETDPPLSCTVCRRGRDGVRLSLTEKLRWLTGKERLYLIQGEILYRLSRECSETLRDLFGVFDRQDRDLDGFVEMGMQEFPAFLIHVLPQIRPYMSVHFEGIDPARYQPEPLRIRFYFDSPSDDEILLRTEFWYGDECFTPLDRNRPAALFRDQTGEYAAGVLIRKYFTSRYAREGYFSIKEDEEAMFRLLDSGLDEFRKMGQVYLSFSMKKKKILSPGPLSVSVGLQGEWMNLKVDAEEMSAAEIAGILAAYRNRQKYCRLRSGNFIKLSGSGFGMLDEMCRGLGLEERSLLKGEVPLPRYRCLYLDRILKDARHVEVSRGSDFAALVEHVSAAPERTFEVPEALKNVLREYQKQGFMWFRTLDHYGFGGILADDMGLGKTIQVISLLLDEAEKNPDMKALIVCPASLIYNWESEILRFGRGLKVQPVTGTAAERRKILAGEPGRVQVYITSYDLLRRDLPVYQELKFRFQILDEAQYIKNHTTQNARAVKRIRAEGKFALTGTPIENRLGDLWSIFDYLMPGFLFSYQKFKKEFEIPIMKENDGQVLERLHKMIGPFLLRRYKKDVLSDLPDKLESVVFSKMEKPQKNLYAANALKLKQELEAAGDEQYAKNRIAVLAQLTRLRQLCCDPGLCYENYTGGSAKLETCMELVSGAVESGHKILLFSQFTSMLDILEERLVSEGTACYKLTGQTGKEERARLVRAFNEDQVPVFLISLKAGGTGLNLTAADVVIHFDPWWNLAAQNQATDRAHRIGQKKVVSVFRLIARDTIEEGILKLQEMKRELTDQVIEQEASSFGHLDRETLIRLLEETNV